jgi:asparagine synthase (glutamine-hydrolysing)
VCGIAGLLQSAPMGADTLRGHVRRMGEVLRPRGPDDDAEWTDAAGRVAFAFRRLAILDLSPAGRQPMASPSGRFVMVFNGEVYNFQELRKTLQQQGASFRGGSDSEVILAAFDRWGIEQTLPRMIGMFAIALWDTEREELVLIRDRMGIKPLYVARTRAGVAFASELGALTRAPGFDGALDPQAILTYLGYLFVPAPGTPLRSVRKLPPGHLMRIPLRFAGASLPHSEPFWTLADARAQGAGARAETEGSSDPSLIASKVDALDEILSDAVRLRMVADVPIGALLSGGLDSSLVVALMQKQSSTPVLTFTIGFDQPEHDESSHARAIAHHIGTDHTELMVSDRDALDIVPALPDIFDEPLADPSQLPTFLVSRLARQQVTVALSGDGGDELFAGYNRYINGRYLVDRLSRTPRFMRRWMGSALGLLPRGTWDGLQALGNGSTRLVGQKARKMERMLAATSAGEMYRTLISSNRPERFMAGEGDWDPIRAGLPASDEEMHLQDMLLLDQGYYLPDDLLQKVDRASMAASLEVRVPILDHRVVEFSWTLSDDLKIRNGQGKWLLRQLLYRNVPRELLERPKTGFSVPVEAWLRGALREWAEFHLFDRSATRDEVFDRVEVERAWKGLLAGRDDDALALWAIVMFEAWRSQWKLEDLPDVVPESVPASPDVRV